MSDEVYTGGGWDPDMCTSCGLIHDYSVSECVRKQGTELDRRAERRQIMEYITKRRDQRLPTTEAWHSFNNLLTELERGDDGPR